MNKMLQENVKTISELDNLKNKINEFLPNFEVYWDHKAILQNNSEIPLSVDKSLDSSTQTEPRNSQNGYF